MVNFFWCWWKLKSWMQIDDKKGVLPRSKQYYYYYEGRISSKKWSRGKHRNTRRKCYRECSGTEGVSGVKASFAFSSPLDDFVSFFASPRTSFCFFRASPDFLLASAVLGHHFEPHIDHQQEQDTERRWLPTQAPLRKKRYTMTTRYKRRSLQAVF